MRQKILLALLVVLPIFFTTTLLTAVHLVRVIWIRMLFHPLLIQRKGGKKHPGQIGLKYQNIVLNTKDGLNLAAWLIPAPGRSSKTVIICHGVVLSKEFFLPQVNFLHKAGYNVLCFDMRSHGRSEGDFVTFGLKEQYDLDAAIDYLKKNHKEKARTIVVYAHSMGAAAAVFAARRRKELKALVLINCFSNIKEDMVYWVTKRGHLPYWPFVALGLKSFKKELKVDLKEVSPEQVIAELNIPVFIINSAKDATTNPKDSDTLYMKAGGPKEFWRIPKAGHETFYETGGKEFEKRVLAFYKKWS